MSQPKPLPAELLIGLGGAVMLGVTLTAQRGVIAGVATGGLAAFGLLVGWAAAPPFVLILGVYLSLFPEGLPAGGPVGREVVLPKLLDLVTAAAAVVYAAGHYRHLSRADAGDEPTPDDLARLFFGAAAAVVVGVACQLVTTRLQPAHADNPLKLVSVADYPSEGEGRRRDPAELGFNRALMLAGLLGGGTLAAGTILWLTRLNRLTPVEARQLLLDTRWRETRRELARLETWRAGVRNPRARRPRPRSRWQWLAAGLMVFAAAFLLFLCVLTRVSR